MMVFLGVLRGLLPLIGQVLGLVRQLAGQVRDERLIRLGRAKAIADAQDRALKAVEVANAARARLRTDPEFADSVRRRFRRD